MNKLQGRKSLFNSIRELIHESQRRVVSSVNFSMLLTYFHIGRMIVEHEQKGKTRAEYAEETVALLSGLLSKEFGRGYSTSNLSYMRNFYLSYKKRIFQTLSGKSKKASILQTPSGKSGLPLTLSWSHYIQLLKIENEIERNFYEIEASQNHWSVRELQRQFDSALFERVALSRDKKSVKALAKKGQIIEQATDALKSHYVLEFLNLEENSKYSENDLETAIIHKLEQFMLELGKGFLFEGRQKRFTFDGDSYYVDLVFYNRFLKCFVLFDLKIGKLTHQDIGQMQMYVNYYDRKIKLREENKTIGIILCKEENKMVVEYTLPENNKQIFAKAYKQILPSKEELRKQLKAY